MNRKNQRYSSQYSVPRRRETGQTAGHMGDRPCVRQESWHPKPKGQYSPKIRDIRRGHLEREGVRSENAEGAEDAEFGRNA